MKFFEKFSLGSQDEDLILTKRQASNICAALIFIFMLAFIAGYFWGKRNSIEEFSSKATNDSFEDKVNYSLYSLYNSGSENGEPEIIVEEAVLEPATPATGEEIVDQVEQMKSEQKIVEGKEYYAELIGFGRLDSANKFLETAKSKGYPVKIVTRKSTNSKGKNVAWHQAVTEKTKDKQSLEDLLEKIRKSERLYGTKIITI